MSERMKLMRHEVRQLIRAQPFRPFVLVVANGERVMVEHPENIALNAGNEDGTDGSPFFYVIGERLRIPSTFDAVSRIVTLDHADA